MDRPITFLSQLHQISLTDKYNHVASLGVEKLRAEYAKAAVTIRAATVSPDQVVEQLVKRVTEDPALRESS